MFRRFLLLTLALTGTAFAQAPAPAPAKIKITSAADLPVHTYTVTSKNRPFAEDPTVVSALAAAVAKDIMGDLARYDIADRSTLRGMYLTLEKTALLQQDYTAVRRYIIIVRSLQDKPADKATSGLIIGSLADALQHPGIDFHQTFQANLESVYRPVPAVWARADARDEKSSAGVITRDLAVAMFAEKVDIPADTGRLSQKEVGDLLSEALALRYIVPNKDDLATAFSNILASHPAGPKVNIWTAREVTLPASAKLKPTVVAIWDSGVDISLYKSQLISGKPGIAFDEKAHPISALLYPMPGGAAAAAKYLADTKSISDFDSPEATAFKTNLAKMTPDQMSDFYDGIREYESYSHGTSVTGIALRGNPAARLLVCRMTTETLTSIPIMPAQTAMYRRSIAYFKTRGVRVVNMSWGIQVSDIEASLEQQGVGKTDDERRTLAKQIYDIGFRGLSDAIHSAPGILFVVAAGNENADTSFNTSYPASIKAPKLIVVGAVDGAGDEASFTSFGNVDIYANGVDVPSFVPGGAIIKSSGTSMAAPQVTNLAAKVLAEHPALSVAQLKAALLRGADPYTVGGKTIRLLNPKKTLAQLNAHP